MSTLPHTLACAPHHTLSWLATHPPARGTAPSHGSPHTLCAVSRSPQHRYQHDQHSILRPRCVEAGSSEQVGKDGPAAKCEVSFPPSSRGVNDELTCTRLPCFTSAAPRSRRCVHLRPRPLSTHPS